MKLIVLGSSSKGNGYILTNGHESLIIECGVRLKEVKKALDFNISSVVGCLSSHSHGDHFKFASEYLAFGIKVFASKETNEALKKSKSAFIPDEIDPGTITRIGNFKVLPFKTIHDAPGSLGFLINHKETGNVLFLTDTHYSEYKFKDLNQIIIEANYCPEIVEKNLMDGSLHPFVYKRLIESHMSINTCIDLLAANDLSGVQNIVLIHLSGLNSDESEFKKMVIQATGKQVFVAKKGLEIDFNKDLF